LKHLIPVMVILLLVSTSFVGVGNQVEELVVERDEEQLIQSTDGPMDSAWPMFGHDACHTSLSQLSTIDNSGQIKWMFGTNGWVMSSPVIDNNGIIYIGADDFYAVYPNGTLKWEYNTDGVIESTAAIDENGVIYVGNAQTSYKQLYAFYPNGTIKWKYGTNANMYSSPVISDEGTIIFSDDSHKIRALYPNGTLKWSYETDHVIHSSPAIGLDGTIYCGSHDCYIYALYPNNGTLKWKFKTDGWVHGSPSVADDGTVYIGSDDGFLYALNPNNGSQKWKCKVGSMRASPALDENGILYFGVWENKFYAVYPNGTIKWKYFTDDKIWGSSAAISADGTIYFGTCDFESSGGRDIIALDSDGLLKWQKSIGTMFSSPAIGEDFTVYIGASTTEDGYLYAFGRGELVSDADGPHYGLINEPLQFSGSAWGGYSPYNWYWNFGDGNTSDEQNPTHIYITPNNYTVTLTVTDNSSNQSSDNTWAWIQESNDPPDKPSINGETKGKIKTEYYYQFLSSDPEGLHIWYFIDWRDGSDTGWIGPYKSGEEITLNHQWSERGEFIIRCKAKDPYDDVSEWGELRITMPHTFWLLDGLLDRFPLLQRLLGRLIL